jgi:hypothetical protein
MRKLVLSTVLALAASPSVAQDRLSDFEKTIIGLAVGAAIYDTVKNPNRPIVNYYAPPPRTVIIQPPRPRYRVCREIIREDPWTGRWETVHFCD